METIEQKIGDHWNKVTRKAGRMRWVHFPLIHQILNTRIAGHECEGRNSDALNLVLSKRLSGEKLPKAISIGAGIALHEQNLVDLGLVEHFDIFDLSSARIEIGKKRNPDLRSSTFQFF